MEPPVTVPEIIPPRRDKIIPYQEREVAASEVTSLEPVRRQPRRRRRTFRADKVEITEEEEGII